MEKLTWNDIDQIALALYEKYPEQDPTFIRFTELHAWIMGLDGFSDDPKKSNEAKLEAIQSAWLDEYREL
jgi:FeS assembly protein IscX